MARERREISLDRSITGADIHDLLFSIPNLTSDERDLIKQARTEVSKEWSIFLKNATVTIRLDDQDVVVRSGAGTNKLLVEEDSSGEIHCKWEEKGLGMKLREGAKKVGRFLYSLFRKAVSAIAFKAVAKFLSSVKPKLPIEGP